MASSTRRGVALLLAAAAVLLAVPLASGQSCSVTCEGFSQPLTADYCIEFDACGIAPCNNGTGVATCTDLPKPAPLSAAGRTCACGDGFVYTNDTVGCEDINACTNHPCTTGANGFAPTCTDSPAPALDNVDGRTCSCPAGYHPYDVVNGCVEINACTANPCIDSLVAGGGTASCTDLPPPADGSPAGRTCTCAVPSYVYNEEKGCGPAPGVCNAQLKAQGTVGVATYQVPVGTKSYVGMLWDMVGVPDLVEVFSGIGTTGARLFRVLGGSSYRCFPNDGTLTPSTGRTVLNLTDSSGFLTVRVTSPCNVTAWFVTLGCSTDNYGSAASLQWPRAG